MVLCLWLAERKKIHFECCHAKAKKCAFVWERDSLFLSVALHLLDYCCCCCCSVVFVYEMTTSFAGACLLLFVCVPPAHPARVFWGLGSVYFCRWHCYFQQASRKQAKYCFPICSFRTGGTLGAKFVSRRHEYTTYRRNTAQDVSDC